MRGQRLRLQVADLGEVRGHHRLDGQLRRTRRQHHDPRRPGNGCAPIGVKAAAAPAPTWNTPITACRAPTSGTCANGGVCLPVSAAGTLCVVHDDDVACPPGPYSNRSLVYTGISDTRGCAKGSCACGTPNCGGSVDLFTSNDCTSGKSSIGIGQACGDVATALTANSAKYAAAITCASSGTPTPTGELGGTGPKTICCM